jgi:hypothetical protein
MIRMTLASIVLAISWPVSAETFYGYRCTQDCSGHQAGYKWAEQKGIESEEDCGGDSNSFIEGCQAYVEEQQKDEDEASEGNTDE